MQITARAPGKAVVLGEYAVLDGAPALVMAVDRHCEARIRPAAGPEIELETLSPQLHRYRALPGRAFGLPLADLVTGASPAVPPFRARVDSRPFYEHGRKLGLGSSAAALCAWAGGWAAWARHAGVGVEPPGLARLIGLHRAFQRGAGSGLDVAASLTGGLIEFRLDAETVPHVGSVRLPNSVGFAGIFAGRSASTPDLVGRYRAWQAAHPRLAAERQRQWEWVAEAGCAAAREDDRQGFLGAVRQYGRCLEALGNEIGADIVTAVHREVGAEAERFGVAYKVSGAGGGDLGLAFSDDAEALAAFTAAVAAKSHRVFDLSLETQGLVVEERVE